MATLSVALRALGIGLSAAVAGACDHKDPDTGGEQGSGATCGFSDQLILSATTDWASDGVPDERTDNAYDNADNLILESRDADLDGECDSTTARTWDDSAHLLTETNDDDADGVAEAVLTNLWSGDNLVIQRVDDDEQGYVETYTYEGDLLAYKEKDIADDGVVEAVWMYAYDDFGRLDTEEFDEGNDGIVDERTVWTYGEGDRPETATTTDEDGWSIVVEYEWDGDLLGRVTTEYDNGWYEWDIYTYDYDDNLVEDYHSDSRDDSTTWKYVWTYLHGRVDTFTEIWDSGTDLVTYDWGCP